MSVEEHMRALKNLGLKKTDIIQAWRALEVVDEDGRTFEAAMQFVKSCDSGNFPGRKKK